MERRLRSLIGAIAWTTLTGLSAAQTGIPKDTQLNPGRVTAGAGSFIVIGCAPGIRMMKRPAPYVS